MSFTFYNYLALIGPNSKADLPQLIENIKAQYSTIQQKLTITNKANNVSVTIDGYNFKISLNESQDELTEAKEMASFVKEDYAGHPIDKSQIESCRRRLELAGEEVFDMDYFNDSLYLIACMEKLGEVIVISIS